MLLVRFIYVLLTLVLAVCVPHFDLLMGLTGSLTGALLSFIFPCIFHIYIKRLNLLYHEGPFTKKIYLKSYLNGLSGSQFYEREKRLEKNKFRAHLEGRVGLSVYIEYSN